MMHFSLSKSLIALIGSICFLQILSCRNDVISQPVKNSEQAKVKSDRKNMRSKNVCYPFRITKRMPQFPGGDSALIKYLHNHIKYPRLARKEGKQSTVVVQFIIQKDGSISDVRAVGRKIGGGLEAEAVRIVKNMPRWKPAKDVSKNRTIKVQYSLPIRFKLP